MMKRLYRVALIGQVGAHVETLLAGLSPFLLLRRFSSWTTIDHEFRAEVIALLPGVSRWEIPGSVAALVLEEPDFRSSVDLEKRLLEGQAITATSTPLERLMGRSDAMAKVRGMISTMAPTPLPLLLKGENGTGKDLAATVVHDVSPRAGGPFVPVNCGAVPAGLAESEFFGCVRGAFTGAENRMGFCQQAMEGTLFLDEVGELPLEVQSKLLRVLENQEVRRVGSGRVESVNFRLICATNRDLAAEVRAGHFREDLYYRINVLPLTMPSLRERLDDIPLLADHFLSRENWGCQRKASPSPRALAKMAAYHWPGNLRQLRNVVLRAAVLHPGCSLEPEHLEWDV